MTRVASSSAARPATFLAVLVMAPLLLGSGCHSATATGVGAAAADLGSPSDGEAARPEEGPRPRQLASGAFLTSTPAGPRVLIHEGNLAALAALQERGGLARAQAWMEWYFGHLNRLPDRLRGTIDDHRLGEDGAEVALGDNDALEESAATFLTLARACFETHDQAAQRYVREHRFALELIGGALSQSPLEGAAAARPERRPRRPPAAAEVARGLADLAWLLERAFGDKNGAAFYGLRANQALRGLAASPGSPGAAGDAATGGSPGPATRSGADPRPR